MCDVKKGGHGLITLQELFEKSSNVGTAMIIQQTFGANPQKFIDYIEQLHMHKPLGIELAGEGKPYMITPKNKMWNLVTLPWLSIGYNLQITPLQALVLYNAVANNGKMVKPMFIRNIKSANGIVQTFPTIVLKEKICSDKTLHKLQNLLEGTVERGSARCIKHSFYKIAGKTGTAEKLVNGKYTDNHLTSFAGYFPADHPRYSCIIVVDSPQGEQFRFGAEVPAPIFKDIVDRIAGKDLQGRKIINEVVPAPSNANAVNLSNTGKTDELSFLYQWLQLPIPGQLNGAEMWANLTLSPAKNHFQALKLPAPKEVPNVLHMKLRDALFLLESSGLTVAIEGTIHGHVCKQSLPPYKSIPADRQIIITLQKL
jgi:cell division protein FtsI (penicillin-binding protein 3)